MDKKNTTIGVVLLLAAFAVMYFTPRPTPPAPTPSANVEPAAAAPGSVPATAANGTTAPAAAATPAYSLGNGTQPFIVPLAGDAEGQKVVTLQNELLTVRLTDFGGAILDAQFRKHRAHKTGDELYDFNQHRAAPILAFVGQPGLDSTARWDVVEQTANRAVFRAVSGKLEVTRTFDLPKEDVKGEGYRLRVTTTLRNLGTEPIGAQRVAWHLGTATAIGPNDSGLYLTTGYYDDDSTTYFDRAALSASSGFLGMGSHPATPFVEKTAAVRWGVVKNQYFASLLSLEKPGVGLVTRRVQVLPGQPETNVEAIGIAADVLLDLPRVEAGATVQLDGKLYVGPNEYSRLKQFDHREDKAMQFDRFFFNKIFLAHWFAPLLLTLLNAAHTYIVSGWGWAIILTTLVLRTVFFPLNLSAAKSAKRMSKIQPLLKEINEKYADNPQKKQKETMALFQRAKVNPIGGCLPILITMPFFIGFYAILQTSSELRFAEWFWIKDLAAPDTIAHLPLFGWNIPINIMPLLMGITQVVQMRLVPTPSMDNAQAKMLQFMPYVMVAICYNFGSGLALYWTVSNLFTIGQQLVVNRMPDVDPLAEADKSKEKNVTPAGQLPKKKLK